MSTNQQALAAEIRAEAAAQRITARDLQRAVRVSSSSWSNYFVACTRDVPLSVVYDVAEELGMPGWELLRRAQVRAATLATDLHAQLDPETQALAEHIRPKRDPGEGRRASGH